MGLNQSALYIGPNDFETDIVSERQLLSYLAADSAGVLGLNDFVVAPGSGHTAVVGVAGAPSRAWLREKTSPVLRGTYFAYSDGQDTINLPVPQSQPFIATVILRTVDPQYGTATGLPGARIDVISNTPASSPSAISDAAIEAGYAQPGAWERLADIRINTADTGAVPAGQFTSRRRKSKRSAGGSGPVLGILPALYQVPTAPADVDRIDYVVGGSVVTNVQNAGGGWLTNPPLHPESTGIFTVVITFGDNTGGSQLTLIGNNSGPNYISGASYQPGGAVVPAGTAMRLNMIVVGYIQRA